MANLKRYLIKYRPLFPYLSIRKYKGGDPAAPSGTATLLRLHPNY